MCLTGGAAAGGAADTGSGLLDLCRSADDTSMGAELLDEITPGGTGAPIMPEIPKLASLKPGAIQGPRVCRVEKPASSALPPAARPLAPRTIDRGPMIDKSLDVAYSPSPVKGRGKLGWFKARRRAPAPPVPPVAPVPAATSRAPQGLSQDDLTSLLMTQAAMGYFDVSTDGLRDLFHRAGAPFDEWDREIGFEIARYAGDDCDRVTRTLEVLALLELVFGSSDAMWRRAAQKAYRFIAGTLGMTPEQVEERLRGLMQEPQKS
jgi:hypothetical protein